VTLPWADDSGAASDAALVVAIAAGRTTFVPSSLRALAHRRIGVGLLMTIAGVGALALGQIPEAAPLAFRHYRRRHPHAGAMPPQRHLGRRHLGSAGMETDAGRAQPIGGPGALRIDTPIHVALNDVASVDQALMTTRAVRRRLDLDRPVDHQIILDCIDIAEQAPTGGNQSSRRWVVVRDQSTKDRLAALYLDAAGRWMIQQLERLAGTGHPQEKVMASAAYLAQHLAEVPVIVVPTIIGVHDGSGRPGLFDSVIQSVWSLCVALRARGLGSAWTTAVFSRQDEFCELLGIPDGMTPIAMLPVGWMKGSTVQLAPRLPARAITYVDRFAHTWERGPSDPGRLADGPGVVVEADIDAPRSTVWRFVTDIGFAAQFSDEFLGARWTDAPGGIDPVEGPAGPRVGATFVGTNSRDDMGTWDVECFVDRHVPRREFGWVTSDPDRPGARWWFELQSIAGGTRLRYRVVLGPGPSGLTAAINRAPAHEPSIIAARLEGLRTNMARVLAGIKAAAEGTLQGTDA
jgi:nitroreductase